MCNERGCAAGQKSSGPDLQYARPPSRQPYHNVFWLAEPRSVRFYYCVSLDAAPGEHTWAIRVEDDCANQAADKVVAR
jgi:hypothetical protein